MRPSEFESGTVLVFHGQQFRLVRFEQCPVRGGRRMWFAVWTTHCRKCGIEFESLLLRHSLALGSCCPEHRGPSGSRTRTKV